tara:strand:- start:2194 stop:2610 length:417 start_codon:yes stop_codon:yes gene_type:complete
MANRVNLDVSERLDITCRKGDTFSLTVTIKDSSGVVLPLVTNNYSFLMQVWGNSKKSKNPVLGSTNLGKKVDNSFEPFVLDDSGNVTITATAATMRVVNPGKYTYDLQYVLPTSSGVDTHTTVLKGSFIINEDTSKSV